MSDSERAFSPDWCLAPDGPLREWMSERAMSVPGLAAACADGDPAAAEALIREVLERKPLGPAHAELLARGTGISVRFWENYEHYYRSGLAAGLKDVSEELP